MPEVSIDEFLNDRKGFVKSGDVLIKAAKSPASWNAETRSARFVMSTEQEDRDRDIVVQAGLELSEFLKNPIAPFAHRSRELPIGTWANVEKSLGGRPKRTEGDLILLAEGDDELADRVGRHIAGGTIRACSIGFVPKTVERREVPEDRRNTVFWPGYMIHEADLVECSPCAIPANPGALAKAAGEGDVFALEVIEEVLDHWAKHPETGLLIPRGEFETAYKEATGNKVSSLSISLDTSEAERGLNQLDGLISKVGERWAKLFGRRPDEQPTPPTLADAEAKTAAAARAAALSERVAAKTVA